jgi:hypothetical protein
VADQKSRWRGGCEVNIQHAALVEIISTRIWIESGITGERVVVLQHEGHDPFDYATFGYNYRYTSNGGTWDAANSLAISLGATEPIEQRSRKFPPSPTAEDLREQIGILTEMLEDIAGERAANAPLTNKLAALRFELVQVTEYADALNARCVADASDAERYRWLRSTTNWVSSKGERINVRDNPALWDESIDAAIGTAGEGEK